MMIDASMIKWVLLGIVSVFAVVAILIFIAFIRVIQMQNTYRKLINLSIENEKRAKLGIEAEKELNAFLFELLKDLISSREESVILYKVYNLRAILTIMEIDHDRMNAFRYIKDTLKYPDSNKMTEELYDILHIHKGEDILSKSTMSAYDKFNRAIDAIEYLDRSADDEIDKLIEGDGVLRNIASDSAIKQTISSTPIGAKRVHEKDNVRIIYSERKQ